MPDSKPPTSKDATPRPFGPFVLERRIAIGGTAEVFYARPRQGQRPAPQLVIKRLISERSHEEHYQALSREAELHRAVRHENVVTVFGAGMVGNEPYLAMEYVAGVDLHRLLRVALAEGNGLPPFVAVYIARLVALALHAVHSALDDNGERLNITHGDVSPSNIYLSTSGDVKLGDFGVAHTAQGADRGESIKGKFGYLAPEQLVGDPFDHRSDIFALGVVLGEMLIGGKIFPGNGQLAILLSIREANIEPLRRAAEQMPAALFQSCTRALERAPDARYPDAAAFAESLEPWFDGTKARAALADHVTRALDANVLARQYEQRFRNASQSQLAGAGRASSHRPGETSAVRRANVLIHAGVSFPNLLELAATGQLRIDDEVSLMGADFRKVEAIAELSRYLMPSTTSTTGQLFQPGVPDFTVDLGEVTMLEVLARLRMRGESGALFVARINRRGEPDRKDMYLSAGRLLHVASSDREELLGQYALRLKLIDQEQLDHALANLRAFGGRLGDTLIGLGLADATAVFRAIRNQGRDRVASLCCWRDGRVHLYRGAEPGQLEFRLDLDLTVPMMAGAMLQLRQPGDPLARVTRLHPGRRFNQAASEEERGGAPAVLLELPNLVSTASALGDVIERLFGWARQSQRVVPEREARAAIIVALALEWLRAE
ncbi:MAG TPA: serine/threonine-protein kinase [Polyangiaceae bacterium]|nr:serine/threonine-protein kinase [Polyangiaceae bacterium]